MWTLSFPLFHSLHAEGYAVAGVVDFYYLDLNLLLKVHHGHGVADILVGKLGDVDKALHLDAEVDEAAEVGDVGNDSRQNHAFLQVVDGAEGGVEGELFVLATRVAAWFAEFLHDVGKGGHAHGVGAIALQVDCFALLCRGD